MSAAAEPAGAEPGGAWYSYAVVRAVPRVERDEFINCGIVVFARELGYLRARIELDEARLRALAPEVDVGLLAEHLATFEAIAAGSPDGGPVAALSASERFHWLTAPRSTMVQTSPVHVGRCSDPGLVLEELMQRLVRQSK